MRSLLLVLLLLLPTPLVQAQVAIDGGVSGAEEPAREDAAPNRVADFLAGAADATGPGPVVAQGMEPYLDEAGMAALRDSLTAYYRYRESGYLHRRAVFDWQLFSSQVIFYVVILLVLLGVYFSWLQFMAEHRRPPRKAEVTVETTEPTEGERPRGGLLTTFKAGSGGLEVSSPVLGIVILAISLAFFYLYLTHVYPINEVF